MNDFTKEELEAIHYDLIRNENPWQCGDSIINKIKFMIDNYCNHDYAAVPNISWHSCKCTKCGRTRGKAT